MFAQSIKSIKMIVWTSKIRTSLLELRRIEIATSKTLEVNNGGVYCTRNVPDTLWIFSPVLILIISARVTAQSQYRLLFLVASLEAKTTYTTIIILTTVTYPTDMLMTIVLRIVVALNSVRRIEEGLNETQIPRGKRA
ncbi:MAG: hypothetical protein FE78DRAFT_73575 [Acidomyces sp. 'richmondensis']|nr:MAG: hypothetical protein FE78DRAFT_73575 [Acidomyces sp. 'richmondensis']